MLQLCPLSADCYKLHINWTNCMTNLTASQFLLMDTNYLQWIMQSMQHGFTIFWKHPNQRKYWSNGEIIPSFYTKRCWKQIKCTCPQAKHLNLQLLFLHCTKYADNAMCNLSIFSQETQMNIQSSIFAILLILLILLFLK